MNPSPFTYPATRLLRRHAPTYNSDWEPYRPWLRDEFGYSCVYCLRRERWIGRRAQFAVDHIVPRASGGALLDYGNLAYACVRCNSAKGDNPVPHPEQSAYGLCVEVDGDGSIRWRTHSREGRMLVRSVRLSEPELTRLRGDEIRYLRNLYRYEPQRFCERMSDPDNVPDLRAKRPTTNSRPESWRSGAHARKIASR